MIDFNFRGFKEIDEVYEKSGKYSKCDEKVHGAGGIKFLLRLYTPKNTESTSKFTPGLMSTLVLKWAESGYNHDRVFNLSPCTFGRITIIGV